MNIFQAIIMGIVQGLAEFLPVSSSGHLAIMQNLLHIETDTGLLFDVLLHLGTLAAIFVVFWKDIVKLIIEFFGIIADFFRRFRDPDVIVLSSAYRRFVLLIIVSTIPTGILGYIDRDFVEYASGTLLVPGIGLIITSVLLFICDRIGDGRKGIKKITYLNAFEIGMAQGVATVPGISRSGATIAACLMLGIKKETAVKYSFIMSIPAVLGAAVLEIKDAAGASVEIGTVIAYIIGMIVSAIVGYFAIRFMIGVVRRKKYIYFSIYCLIVGLIAIIGYFITK
ncbi:MAG: undecaprenyl-diphosphate phosphatase [Lachnospiraceae bacterium]|nr:undecaprenyl-diphosphate phosphatase [Lachnospiraceae bacterium]MBQ9607182.1 undecaprenyl-diphosphate phosphatase [Lachnospiraceae bacterium]MBR1522934.1 undecaprenyl-diphosphate phosphatase [Lachnospiraceae bacterium]